MSSATDLTESVQIEQHPQRIFLYMRLKAVERMPFTEGKLEIHLSHVSDTLTKLEDHYPTENIIDLSIFEEYKPTFSLMLEQDNLEDMNMISDNPLLITLYDRVMVRVLKEDEEVGVEEEVKLKSITDNFGDLDGGEEGEEEETVLYEEQLTALAQGHIDLLRLYTNKRELVTTSSILYPFTITKNTLVSCITTWEIYALMPLLKELTIHNIVYISFESIFNVRSSLADYVGTLVADFYFEAKLPNVHNQNERVKFCTYSNFSNERIPDRYGQLKWETLKDGQLDNYDCLGIHSGNSVNLDNVFRHLVYAENSQIITEKVNLDDPLITTNSTHRYILSGELVHILEDVLAFDEQQLLIELYNADQPDDILAQGRIDVSILLYPEVNAVRFAVQLYSTTTRPGTKLIIKPSTSRAYIGQVPEGPMFAIISVCFLNPLTESYMPKSMERPFSKLSTVKSVFYKLLGQRLEAYHNFERQIRNVIFYIIKNHVKKVEDAKGILCCQKENLTNKLMKIISYDFNVKTPTKDSIEFNNLMTNIYKYAVQCAYDILKSFGNKVPIYFFAQNNNRVINYCTTAQYLSLLGEERFSKCFWDKAEKLSAGDPYFQFLKLVSDVEKLDFETAKYYYSRPKNEQFEIAQDLTDLINIYIKYVETLANEVTFNQAMENLIIDLREILTNFPKDICFWVLLHCIFKYCEYLPGISYTRWRYEQLQSDIKVNVPKMPMSRYRLVNPCELIFPNTIKQALLLDVFNVMTQLGLYKFGEFIFREFQQDCTPLERYLIQTTLKILINEVPSKYPAKTFPISKGKNRTEMETEKAYLLNVNGHLEYNRGAFDLAMQNYGQLLNMNIETSSLCSLALLRYGFYMLNHGEYKSAEQAFIKCILYHIEIIANYGLGRALFKMKKLDEAELAFQKCTTHKIHIPDVWGYLALINLLQKKNYKALEFWKYSKINPNVEFSWELQQELENVDINEISLIVEDIPSK